jgi:hypothetical protein
MRRTRPAPGNASPTRRTTADRPSPAAIVGGILALGVIRLLQRQARLDSRAEESVHAGVLTTQEKARE